MKSLSKLLKKQILFEAIRMARLSIWIYDDRKNGFPLKAPPLEGEVISVAYLGSEEGSTQGAAVITRDKIFFVFRGSQSPFSWQGLKDWIANFKFVGKVDFRGIKAHRGHVAAIREVEAQVIDIVQMYDHLDRIDLGGHSLGGNIAIGSAVAIIDECHRLSKAKTIKCITLGQPRFSRKRLLNLVMRHASYLRIQNGSDVVPRKPHWILRYSHGGKVIYTSNSGELLWDPSWIRKFFDRLFTLRQRGTDHRASEYLHQLLIHAKSFD